MANLNLSEFGEKLFVADADHTFIWDTVGAISKRVSRNSWLNSGTLTSDAPVTISQTWNNAAVAFTGLKVNAVSTNSAAGSLLLDLQTGGVSKASFNKDGSLTIGGGNISDGGFGFLFKGFGVGSFFVGQNGSGSGAVALGSSSSFGFSSLGTPTGLTLDTILVRDSASGNTLALRNGAAAQTFNVYGTSSSSNTVYERMFMRYTAASTLAFQIGTEQVGATVRPLEFLTAGVKRLSLSAAGSPVATLFSPSNTVSNLLVLRNLSDIAKFQFYLNGSGNSELYIGANVLISETGSSYFNGGNVGIGTPSPTSKLQVTGGDVEIETVTSGIIMKAAGTSTRYRITLNAGGTALVFTAI